MPARAVAARTTLTAPPTGRASPEGSGVCWRVGCPLDLKVAEAVVGRALQEDLAALVVFQHVPEPRELVHVGVQVGLPERELRDFHPRLPSGAVPGRGVVVRVQLVRVPHESVREAAAQPFRVGGHAAFLPVGATYAPALP